MIFSKELKTDYVNGVHLANGSVRFQSVQLNVYAFVIDGIAIDTGPNTLSNYIRPFWQDKEIESLYLTHIHEDHTGNADWFKENLDIPIYINEKAIPIADKKGTYPFYRRAFWGKREAFHAKPLPERFKSKNHDWVSIFTTGHSFDHMALLNESTGQLFSGDIYVQTKTKVLMKDESIASIIQSIKTLLAYDFKEVFCSHAGLLKDGRKKLENKLEYLMQLEDKVLTLHQQGHTEKEIHKQIFPKRYPIVYFSLGEWDSKNIVHSILRDHQLL